MFPKKLALILVFGWSCSRSVAAPPTVTSLTPPGAERGKAVEVLVQGANLTAATKLIVPFKAEIKPLPAAKPVPNQMRYQIIVDPATPIGIYPLRLFDDGGVSVTLRREKGHAIDAACGQLRLKTEKAREAASAGGA